ncbi:MAG: hypothetical protein Hyperionvirus26_28 [Hyperionvirus sp.]|uniref:Uncharacterized protein n=1 Tax=Hyperionvirus sp. TaxID=2487770 RepID=A0A3G5AF14_9VIRU|nr:MAG: hypothetical protein Hyperionvirus26_28 [Hyperionvirus sp.]
MFEKYFVADCYCKCCYSDITADNYALYKNSASADWLPSSYCKLCLKEMLLNGWTKFIGLIDKADCAAALKRLIDRPPPINLRDPECFPNGDVELFYFDDTEQSAKLHGSLTGEAHVELWNKLKDNLKLMELSTETT